MKPEDKKLLLQDLCARLPYGVMCTCEDWPSDIYKKLLKVMPFTKNPYCIELDNGEYMPTVYMIDEIKPYLRLMSSMTDEERIELDSIPFSRLYKIVEDDLPWSIANYRQLDWLNTHHFDFRGLIERGLALEAPEEMYMHLKT